MSATLGVLAQSPEPEARDKVLDNNSDRIGIWKCWVLRRGENRSTQRKTSRSKDKNQQQTQPTYDAESGNWTRATMVGRECSHHCAIPAPLQVARQGLIPWSLTGQETIFNASHRSHLTFFSEITYNIIYQDSPYNGEPRIHLGHVHTNVIIVYENRGFWRRKSVHRALAHAVKNKQQIVSHLRNEQAVRSID